MGKELIWCAQRAHLRAPDACPRAHERALSELAPARKTAHERPHARPRARSKGEWVRAKRARQLIRDHERAALETPLCRSNLGPERGRKNRICQKISAKFGVHVRRKVFKNCFLLRRMAARL